MSDIQLPQLKVPVTPQDHADNNRAIINFAQSIRESIASNTPTVEDVIAAQTPDDLTAINEEIAALQATVALLQAEINALTPKPVVPVTYILVAATNQYQAVRESSPGFASILDNTLDNGDSILGLAQNTGVAGTKIQVFGQGSMVVDTAWTWTAHQPVYFTTAGGLTQTVPTTGYRCIAGYAITGQVMLVLFGEPIFQNTNGSLPQAVHISQTGVLETLSAYGIRFARAMQATNLASLSGLGPIAGVTLNDGDRVFLPNQTTTTQRGLWIAHGGGSPAWTRPPEFFTGTHAAGLFVTVGSEGSVDPSSLWTCTSAPASDIVDTSPLTFAQFTGSGTVTSVSVVTANGVSASVATPTTTPALTFTLGAITPSSVAATGNISAQGTGSGATASFGTSTVAGSVLVTGPSTSVTQYQMFQPGAELVTFASNTSGSTYQGIPTGTFGISDTAGMPFVVVFGTTEVTRTTTAGFHVNGTIVSTGNITGANLSGTNTGDVTLGTPNGLFLSGQVLSMGIGSTVSFGTYKIDGTTITAPGGVLTATGGGGSGTVTSFSAGNLTPLFTTSVSSATTTPALSFSAVTVSTPNLVYASQVSGSGIPSFRSLVVADIPSLILAAGTGAIVSGAVTGATLFSNTIPGNTLVHDNNSVLRARYTLGFTGISATTTFITLSINGVTLAGGAAGFPSGTTNDWIEVDIIRTSSTTAAFGGLGLLSPISTSFSAVAGNQSISVPWGSSNTLLLTVTCPSGVTATGISAVIQLL